MVIEQLYDLGFGEAQLVSQDGGDRRTARLQVDGDPVDGRATSCPAGTISVELVPSELN